MRRQILVLTFILAIFSLVGCKDLLTQHNIELDGVDHGKKLYQGAKDCTACHGVNLNGNGFIPGCYSCHDQLWSKEDHSINRGGAMHRRGYMQARNNCSSCHGDRALTGKRSRPDCSSCHERGEDTWLDLENHTRSVNGYYHMTGMYEPDATVAAGGCADSTCHGTDLAGSQDGGGAQSCNACHGDWWIKTPHDNSEDGYGHGRNYKNPYTWCAPCHGADLRGGTKAPSSCFKCHGAEWLDD